MTTLSKSTCCVDDCDRAIVIRRMCRMHYQRVKTWGDALSHIKPMVRHGMARSSTYSSWLSMKRRCEDPKSTGYYKYGARGISVCDRWKDYLAFYDDMGDRPEGMTLDRIDPSGNYEPSNCRWATVTQQAYNRRKRLRVSSQYRGVSYSAKNRRYVVHIAKENTKFYLGVFRQEELAAYEYDQWALALYGDDAHTNFEYQ